MQECFVALIIGKVLHGSVTYVRGGLIFAAMCGENRLTVLVTFSLNVLAKL